MDEKRHRIDAFHGIHEADATDGIASPRLIPKKLKNSKP